MSIRRLLLLLSLLLISTFAFTKEVRLCYETDSYQPFSTDDNKYALITGNIFIERITKAVENAGFKAIFYRRSWGRCIQDLVSGKNDVIFPTLWMKGREKWGRFPRDSEGNIDNSRAIRKATYRIYTPIKSQLQWDGKLFSELSSGVGAPFGYVVYHMLKKAGYLSPIDRSVEEGFKMLALNRLDAYVIEKQAGEELIKREHYQDKITALPIAFHASYFHLLLSHHFYSRDPIGAEKIWDELKVITGFTSQAELPVTAEAEQKP